MNSETVHIMEMRDEIRAILAGQTHDVQGACLADLLATWLASHAVRGDRKATDRLRRNLLEMHIVQVKALIDINAMMLGTDE